MRQLVVSLLTATDLKTLARETLDEAETDLRAASDELDGVEEEFESLALGSAARETFRSTYETARSLFQESQARFEAALADYVAAL